MFAEELKKTIHNKPIMISLLILFLIGFFLGIYVHQNKISRINHSLSSIILIDREL